MIELNRLCMETGAGVVLTTLGRYECSMKALHRTLLAKGFDSKIAVLGETRDLGAYPAAEKRGDLMFQVTFKRWSKGREIAAWLKEHPGARRFVVIDDQPHICLRMRAFNTKKKSHNIRTREFDPSGEGETALNIQEGKSVWSSQLQPGVKRDFNLVYDALCDAKGRSAGQTDEKRGLVYDALCDAKC